MQYIKIHALDNVAVALADLAEGTEVSVDNQTVTLRQDVARGHKFALTDIAKGANVIKYGLPIGYALADIAARTPYPAYKIMKIQYIARFS